MDVSKIFGQSRTSTRLPLAVEPSGKEGGEGRKKKDWEDRRGRGEEEGREERRVRRGEARRGGRRDSLWLPFLEDRRTNKVQERTTGETSLRSI